MNSTFHYYSYQFIFWLNMVILIGSIVLIIIHYEHFKRLRMHQIFMMILSFGILVGLHGILHIGMDLLYGHDPWRYFKKKEVIIGNGQTLAGDIISGEY